MKLHQKIFLLLVLFLPIQLGRHFWPNWSYVMGLRVDYLSPTIYLTDILVLVILLLWGIEKFKMLASQDSFRIKNLKLKIAIQNAKFLFLPLLIFVFLLVNCFLAQNHGAAFYKLLKIIEFSFLGFYVARIHYSLFTIHYSLIGAVIYSSLIALAQFLKQSSLGGIFYWLGERTFNAGTPGIAKIDLGGRLLMRPYATFPHPNILAGFTLVSLILIFNSKSKNTSDGDPKGLLRGEGIINMLALFFGIITIFISFSRATWLVGLFVGLWMLKGLQVKVLRVTSYGLLIFLLTLYLIKPPIFPEESFTQRMELNKISLQLIKQSPLVGIGLNNFIVHLPEFWRGSTYWLQPVHNIYLLVVAEIGIIGLLIFLWFIFLTIKKLLIINSKLLIALSAILALGLFDHYWLTLQQTQLLFAFVLGLSWGNAKIAS